MVPNPPSHFLGLARLHAEALAIGLVQRKYLFKPKPAGIIPLQTPEAYGLANMQELFIETPDRVRLHLWHRKEQGDAPLFVLFHGNTGNWADLGNPVQDDVEAGVKRDYRLNLLRTIPEDAGILAVSLRGYGKSTGIAHEKGFITDSMVLAKYLREHHSRNDSLEHLILLGESMGAAKALMTTEAMHKDAAKPGLTVMIAPFTNTLHKAGDTFPHIPLEILQPHIRHHFDSLARLERIPSGAGMLFLTPQNDATTLTTHSDRLAAQARILGHKVAHLQIPGGHTTWSPAEVVEATLQAYKQSPPVAQEYLDQEAAKYAAQIEQERKKEKAADPSRLPG